MKKKKENSVRQGPVIAALTLFIPLLLIAFFFNLVNNLPLVDTFLFYGALFVFIYAPGSLVLRAVKIHDDCFSNLALSFLVGMSLMPLVYYLFRLTGMPWIFFLVALAVSVGSLYFIFSNLKTEAARIIEIKSHHWIWLSVVIVIIIFLLQLSHFSDVVFLKGGGFLLRTSHMTETITHLGIVNELKYTVPPVFPYASGVNLSYHLDMHILTELLSRYTGISTLVLSYYYMPLLYFLLLVSVTALFFYKLHGNLLVSLLFGLLLFGADLSFIPGLFGHFPETYTWTLIFKTPIWGLFTLNGILPATIFLFGFLMVFNLYYKSGQKGYLVLALLFAFAAFRIKSSMGAQIVGCAIPAVIFLYWRDRKNSIVGMTAAMVAAAALILLDFLFRPPLDDNLMKILFDPFNGFLWTARQLQNKTWLAVAGNPASSISTFILLFIVYIIGFMGIRIACVRDLFRMFRKNISVEPVVPFLLIFVFGGIMLSEFIFIGTKYDWVNNGTWFAVQSLYAALYFPMAWAATMGEKKLRVFSIVLLFLFSFPTTVQFLFLRNDNQYIEMSSNELKVIEFIQKETPADSVVLELPRLGRPSLSAHFAGRVTVLSTFRTFVMSSIGETLFKQRMSDIVSFYSTGCGEECRNILERYGVKFILVPSEYNEAISKMTFLRRIMQSEDLNIYEVK